MLTIEISFYGIIVVIKTYIVGRKIFLFLLREEINSISALINLLHTKKRFWEKYSFISYIYWFEETWFIPWLWYVFSIYQFMETPLRMITLALEEAKTEIRITGLLVSFDLNLNLKSGPLNIVKHVIWYWGHMKI